MAGVRGEGVLDELARLVATKIGTSGAGTSPFSSGGTSKVQGPAQGTVLGGTQTAKQYEAAAEEIAHAAEKAKTAFSGIGSALGGVVTQLGQVALGAGSINFAAAQQGVRSFEEATARLGVAAGESLGRVRQQFEQIGQATGTQPDKVAAWAAAVGRLTYDFQGARDSFAALNAEGVATGRSADEMERLGVVLHNSLGVTEDMTSALGSIRAQAQALGTTGGPAALEDQLTRLGPVLSQLSTQTEGQRRRLTALAAEVGHGLSPEAAARAQQGVLGVTEQNAYMIGKHFLGMRTRDIYDEQGHVKDLPGMVEGIQKKAKAMWGDQAFEHLMTSHGAEGAAAILNFRRDKFEAAAKSSPTGNTEAAAKLEQFLGTDAGKRAQAEAQLAVSARDLLGSSSMLGKAADALQRFSAANPVLGSAAGALGGTALSGISGGIGGLVKGIGGGTVTALGSGSAAGGGLLPMVAAGAAGLAGGYAAGSWAEEHFGLSDKLLDLVGVGSLKSNDEKAFAADEKRRQARRAMLGHPAVAAEGAAPGGAPGGAQSLQQIMAQLNETIAKLAESAGKDAAPKVTVMVNPALGPTTATAAAKSEGRQ